MVMICPLTIHVQQQANPWLLNDGTTSGDLRESGISLSH